MEVLEAIYRRRAVRTYTRRKVERDTILSLLKAAVRAPSAANSQPWAFAVIQDENLLRAISDEVKTRIQQNLRKDRQLPCEFPGRIMENVLEPDFSVFYDATTLILIFARSGERDNSGDCYLAGQNLMLAACAMGLGTCPVGFAREVLNLPEMKGTLGIPVEYDPVLSLVVGYPESEPPAVDRAEPKILFWK